MDIENEIQELQILLVYLLICKNKYETVDNKISKLILKYIDGEIQDKRIKIKYLQDIKKDGI